MAEYHSLNNEDIFKLMASSESGLSDKEADKRLAKNGENILSKEKPYSRLGVFFSQFKSTLIYVLVAAVFLSFLAGEIVDAQVIAAAILINVVIGFVQEDKANSALQKLKTMVEHKAIVRRNGKEVEIPAAKIVVGDILVLRAGRFVLADAKLFASSDLETNEASLTGESSAVMKNANPDSEETVLADRKSMVYAGTNILNGKGLAVVVATGKNTEIGKISEMVKNTVDGATPLQERLAGVSKFLGLAALVACLAVVISGLIYNYKFLEIFSSAAAIAVAAVPEGMAVSVTVILALGMKQVVKKKALARKLLAAETLGSITVICSDKTGTLTEGVMKLEKFVFFSESFDITDFTDEKKKKNSNNLESAFKVGLLCNNAVLSENGNRDLGSALEVSLLKSAAALGFNREKFQETSSELAEFPFSSANKFMISLRQENNIPVLYEKGAGEMIIDKCVAKYDNGRVEKMSADDCLKLRNIFEDLTASGYRVIALAYRRLESIPFSLGTEHKDWSLIDNQLTFVAFAVFRDPLRKEAKNTIALCRKAGIRPIIITGDHAGTALAIAKNLGMGFGDNDVVSGEYLNKINDGELRELSKKISIYARVSPEHKIRIVNALKYNGEVVAMTGDGLNDSPALKAADIGICLGSGTEVAKETADLVLLDDNFSVIVGAIEQGRIIFNNIRKSLTYIVSDSFSEIILVLGSIIFHMPLALLPTQILWINIVNDGLPNFSLAFEKGDASVMNRRPIKREEPIFNSEMKIIILGVGIVRDICLFALFFYFSKKLAVFGLSFEYLRTLFFSILIFKSLFSIFSLRSFNLPIHKIKHFHNPYLFLAFFSGLFLMVLAVYSPFLNKMLGTVPLEISAWIIVLVVALINIAMIEIVKFFFNRKKTILSN